MPKLFIDNRHIEVSKRTWELAHEFRVADDPHMVYMINCGLHSGVRECCAIFYAFQNAFREELDVHPEEKSRACDLLHAYYNGQKGNRCHSLCPACRLAKRVAPRMSPCTCMGRPHVPGEVTNDTFYVEFRD